MKLLIICYFQTVTEDDLTKGSDGVGLTSCLSRNKTAVEIAYDTSHMAYQRYEVNNICKVQAPPPPKKKKKKVL